MNDVLLWIGPVSKDMLVDDPGKPSGKPVLPDSWEIKTCQGSRSDTMKEWALSLGPEPLQRLVPKAERIVIAGFSAGHGAIEILLGRSVNDSRLVGLLALDAYYSAWRVTTPKPGYLAWCRAAAMRGLPAWLTTSSHHPAAHPGASESIQPLVKALGMVASDDVPTALTFANAPVPKVKRANSVLWLDYGAQIPHKDHVHLLARHALANGPFLQTQPVPIDSRKAPAQASSAARAPLPPSPPTKPQSSNVGLGIGIALALGGLTYLLGRQK